MRGQTIKVKMKKPVCSILILLAIALSGVSACMRSSDCFSEEVFCAALVTDTLGIEDHGINQDTWAGMEEAKTNGHADQIEYIESIDTRDYEKNINYFAERGFDVIFTTGIGLRDETLLYFAGYNQIADRFRSLCIGKKIIIAKEYGISADPLYLVDNALDIASGITSFLAQRIQIECAELAIIRTTSRA